MNSLPHLLAATSNAALISFVIYSAAVLLLAVGSHFLFTGKSFMAEYFLGSRSLGVWAFMLTFAATSASAGSFAGFPALIYAHGWILALWIGGYMVVPLVAMGLLGKRINRMARMSDSITLPELMYARFGSRAVTILATLILVVLLMFYLIPQFKLASIILQELLKDVPLWKQAAMATGNLTQNIPLLKEATGGYLLGLSIFSLMVIFYTSFGGFRAVVWTDMLQGVVMFFGVAVLLILTLIQVGGLRNATEQIAEMTTPKLAIVQFERPGNSELLAKSFAQDSWFLMEEKEQTRLFRINETLHFPEEEITSNEIKVVEITGEAEKTRILKSIKQTEDTILPKSLSPTIKKIKEYQSGANQKGVYVSGPGPSEKGNLGFLPISLGISFFVFFSIGNSGQPGNMVRLMAFDSTKTFKRAMALLVIYFGVIYASLVIIFCCSRILVPGLEQTPDRIMPVLSLTVANNAGFPWLAGILIAAPFAAAMSTVDSFMLMISSSLVRDIYQREVNPNVSEKTVKRLSYLCTMVVGVIVMLFAVSPPKFMQAIIIFTGGGLAATFLMPMVLAIYWPRFNWQGAIAGMAAGFITCLALYAIGYLTGDLPINKMKAWNPLSFDTMIWGVLISAIASVIVCKRTPPPSEKIIQKFFR